jgi:organic radical activating enzyme
MKETGIDLLVITGGEPTLQINLLALVVRVLSKGYRVQFETNGTQGFFIAEANKLAHTDKLSFVVSPKANLKAGRYGNQVADYKQTLHPVYLKFVVSADISNVHHTLPDWAINSDQCVYISPMAVYKKAYTGEISSAWDSTLIDAEVTSANYAYAANYALELTKQYKKPFLLSLQTHLFTAIP